MKRLGLFIALALMSTHCEDNLSNGPSELKFSAQIQNQIQVLSRVDDNALISNGIGLFVKDADKSLTSIRKKTNIKLAYSNGYFLPAPGMPSVKYPDNGNSVDFIAYYPYMENLNNYAIPIDVSDQTDITKVDILYSANAVGLNNDSTPTPDLIFTHQLSRIVLNIEFADESELKNTRVLINGMKTKASFDLSNATFTIDDKSVEVIEANVVITDDKARAEIVVLPSNSMSGIIGQIVTNGKAYNWDLSREGRITSINKGLVYSYSIKLNEHDVMGASGYNELPVATLGLFCEGTMRITHTVPASMLNRSFTQAEGSVRNYTLLYSNLYRVAYWVAYPMYRAFLGNASRTNDWNYDPEIPRLYQPQLMTSWIQSPIPYDRGHQIPSADRTSSEYVNQTTFYFSNMTPQNQSMNGNQWAKLENQVREWCRQTDTLYVVTGAILPETLTYAEDKTGNKAAVPKAYYKALAKKVGDRYYTIGYRMDNRAVSGIFNDYQVTVSSLEEETGLIFFPKITDSDVKDHIDSSVWN